MKIVSATKIWPDLEFFLTPSFFATVPLISIHPSLYSCLLKGTTYLCTHYTAHRTDFPMSYRTFYCCQSLYRQILTKMLSLQYIGIYPSLLQQLPTIKMQFKTPSS